MKALIELRDYISLEAFAKSKKSPIGYVQFVILLLNSGATKQAISYITKCDPGDRVELYVKCGEWVLAGKEAVKRSDRATLMLVFRSFLFFFERLIDDFLFFLYLQ